LRIPANHPRFESLRIRELLANGIKRQIVVPQGLLAHGRGEAFDYILGERTGKAALGATRAGAALLLTANHPVISVNGNTAALVPKQISKLASITGSQVEVNLFHRSLDRERKIAGLLRKFGVREVMGVGKEASSKIQGVSSLRRRVDPRGIGSADVVLVPLEDGDRASALESDGKKVIAIDLNPLSRTSRVASITIVDNIVRAIPHLVTEATKLKGRSPRYLSSLVSNFDNKRNLSLVMKEIVGYLEKNRGFRVD
jgi:4-phosphopantoate---beta-alanine ligase